MSTALTRTFARLLLLPILVVALGILVKGYAGVGDGFSAGVIAALAVLLQYVACGYGEVARRLPLALARPLTAIGLLLALAVAFAPVVLGQPFLSHLPAPGEHVVQIGALELHTAILFDLGVFLLVFGFIVSTADALAGALREQRL